MWHGTSAASLYCQPLKRVSDVFVSVYPQPDTHTISQATMAPEVQHKYPNPFSTACVIITHQRFISYCIMQSDGRPEHWQHINGNCGWLYSLKKDQMCTAAVLNWWEPCDIVYLKQPLKKKPSWAQMISVLQSKNDFVKNQSCVDHFIFFSHITDNVCVENGECVQQNWNTLQLFTDGGARDKPSLNCRLTFWQLYDLRSVQPTA